MTRSLCWLGPWNSRIAPPLLSLTCCILHHKVKWLFPEKRSQGYPWQLTERQEGSWIATVDERALYQDFVPVQLI